MYTIKHAVICAIYVAFKSAVTIFFVVGAIGCQRLAERPNILFIMADDHGCNAISAYGSVINRTPRIDRLASEGMQFNNAFVTNSICAPSRAVIITGKYNHVNGLTALGQSIDRDQPFVQDYLHDAGYQTAMIGKWHLGSEPRGFDHYSILPGQGKYYDPVFITQGDTAVAEGYCTNIVTDKAIEWIQGRDADRPFFAMVHHKAPHVPHLPEDKYKNAFQEDLPLPKTFDDDKRDGSRIHSRRHKYSRLAEMAEYDLPRTKPVPGELDSAERKEWIYQEFFKGYLRLVASLDDNVGRLVDFIDQAGLRDNTIVFYTSDNGFFMGDHGFYNKMWMYEESLQVPLIVRWPGKVPAGTTNDQMVLNLDFAPTWLDLAGAEIPREMQGMSFGNLLRGKDVSKWRDAMYYRFYSIGQEWVEVPEHYGIRTKESKLMYFPEVDEWEFYDLDNDPGEVVNAYGDPEYQAQIEEAEIRLKQLRSKYSDND